MRVCANENIPLDCIVRLREQGHDVLWIREETPGIADKDVLVRAFTEERLLVTFDKDFGALVFQLGVQASHGVILFRISQPSAASIAERVSAVLASRNDWSGHFSVIDDDTIRMRPLPKS